MSERTDSEEQRIERPSEALLLDAGFADHEQALSFARAALAAERRLARRELLETIQQQVAIGGNLTDIISQLRNEP